MAVQSSPSQLVVYKEKTFRILFLFNYAQMQYTTLLKIIFYDIFLV